MPSTGEDCSLFLHVLILLNFASRIPLIEYLQCRVGWVTTPHLRWPSPMVARMAVKAPSEKKDDSENNDHA